MDALLAKLTNLGYEFFGIFLPGLVSWTFMLLWWTALGPLAPHWSRGVVPAFSVADLKIFVESITAPLVVAGLVPALMSVYFLGHILHWLARSGQPIGAANGSLIRIRRALLFRIPKPNDSYSPRLQPLFEVIQGDFSRGQNLEWVQLFPVLKSFLSRKLTHSLVATYQNKYTLHRSVTAGAAAWFWLNILTVLLALMTVSLGGPSAYWPLLFVCTAASVVLVWGFSDSYMYHWTNFGNSIVTETYSLLKGPKDERHE